jgi:coenzyme F420-reducing hydrogenase delta subunit
MTEANVSTTSSSAATVPEDWKPHIVALVCNWCSYAGADMAGTTRLEYPANVRMVRFPCTGRMSPLMILRAFEHGADGVLVSGCHPGDCHYVQGNLVARRRFTIFRSLMDFIGIDLKRLHFAWVSAAEGHKWAKVVNEVTASVQEAGPLPGFEYPEGWDGINLPDMAGNGPQEFDERQLAAIRANLQKAATEALSRNRADVVIGYGPGALTSQTIPVFVTDAADCDKLVWGQECRNNLASYVGSALDEHERVAVVAKTCDLGGLSGLIREGQIRRDQLLVIGVQCPGVIDGSELASKCLSCSGDPHPICDLVVSVDGVHESCQDPAAAALDTPDARDEQIAHLEALPHDERWRYWQRQFSRCLRCYACRAACPMLYC